MLEHRAVSEILHETDGPLGKEAGNTRKIHIDIVKDQLLIDDFNLDQPTGGLGNPRGKFVIRLLDQGKSFDRKAKRQAAPLELAQDVEIPLDGERGMMQLSPEAMAKSDPDVILLTDFGYDQLGSLDKIKELPGVAGTKAAKANRIFRVEEHDMVYLGPRTGEIVQRLQNLIRQNAAQ